MLYIFVRRNLSLEDLNHKNVNNVKMLNVKAVSDRQSQGNQSNLGAPIFPKNAPFWFGAL